jgi:glutamate N-acetyltransferase/amino-acid N-acetyltransferase
MEKSPLAPKSYPKLPPIAGVQLTTASCGIKYKDRADVLLVELAEGSSVAGVFTRSKTASANIHWGREALSFSKARILLVNAGNANAFNGRMGEESVARIVGACASQWQCDEKEVYPCATGVIGEPLPDDLITEMLSSIKGNLASDGWYEAANTITTTDTFPKLVTGKATIDGKEVTINAIAKGSGMIAPDMATMLAYVFTDATISSSVLQSLLSDITERSFNAITVDSDTSTSDTLLAFATNQVEHEPIDTVNDERLDGFKEQLESLLIELAHQIVRDGEGATKFVEVNVTGASSDKSAKVIAMAVANSPLVKTAIAGEDANWGRIVMAVGKSGEEADRDKLSIAIGGISIAKDGQLDPAYQEAQVVPHMKGEHIVIDIALGLAEGSSTVWTGELTHGYISINADYRS